MSKKNGTTKRRPNAVDYNKFVQLWRASKTVGEVAKALGIRANSCSAIANRLRKQGVKHLKRFPRRAPQTVDLKKLNRIA